MFIINNFQVSMLLESSNLHEDYIGYQVENICIIVMA